jgi:hypothetical protein
VVADLVSGGHDVTKGVPDVRVGEAVGNAEKGGPHADLVQDVEQMTDDTRQIFDGRWRGNARRGEIEIVGQPVAVHREGDRPFRVTVAGAARDRGEGGGAAPERVWSMP